MDLDYALREDHPSDLTSASTAKQRSTMEKWERSNRMSLMIIKHSIPEAIRGAIPEETRSKTFLDQIANRFTANEKVETTLFLIQGTKVRVVRRHTCALGLISLLTQFSPFKISYNTQKEKWTLNELIAQCVQEEERLKQENWKVLTWLPYLRDWYQQEKKRTIKENKLQFLGHQSKRYGCNYSHKCHDARLPKERMPTDGERYIYVGNGNKVAVKAIDEVENQLSKKIKAVKSDRGSEYCGRYDGSGEQRPGRLPNIDGVWYHSSVHHVGDSKPKWSSREQNRTLKDMGCPTEARPYKPNEKKLDSRTVNCYFVGYSEGRENVQPITEIVDTPEIPPTQVMEPVQVHEEQLNNLKNLKYKCH
ncbi:hypothetical protein CK203_023167 [Vitis vinifera]|uniref:Uncharacterized protein n=1 Tax=Vitis vinifera TaxID=29760 RepID=A0A438J1Q2_VITVI|nr:hypothetical protein CK203_023167 [Vitis vinifera]